jgi:hypothetical protein
VQQLLLDVHSLRALVAAPCPFASPSLDAAWAATCTALRAAYLTSVPAAAVATGKGSGSARGSGSGSGAGLLPPFDWFDAQARALLTSLYGRDAVGHFWAAVTDADAARGDEAHATPAPTSTTTNYGPAASGAAASPAPAVRRPSSMAAPASPGGLTLARLASSSSLLRTASAAVPEVGPVPLRATASAPSVPQSGNTSTTTTTATATVAVAVPTTAEAGRKGPTDEERQARRAARKQQATADPTTAPPAGATPTATPAAALAPASTAALPVDDLMAASLAAADRAAQDLAARQAARRQREAERNARAAAAGLLSSASSEVAGTATDLTPEPSAERVRRVRRRDGAETS